MRIVEQTRQTIWGRAAVINFTLGSSAASFYIIAVATEWAYGGLEHGQTALTHTGIAIALMSVGFLLLALESGNWYKSAYSLSNLRSSWMSREVLLAGMFFIFGIAGLVDPLYNLQIVAAAAAFLFMVTQAFIIFRARAILAWNVAPVPILMLLSGTSGGLGIFLVFHHRSPADSIVLLTSIGILSLTLLVWVVYVFVVGRSSLEWRRATADLRAGPSLVLTVGVGSIFPVVLIALASPYNDLATGRVALSIAGASMLLGRVSAERGTNPAGGIFSHDETGLIGRRCEWVKAESGGANSVKRLQGGAAPYAGR
jgi:DMSO reductase anchor subunit